jgi:hypothetical protein
MAEPATVSVGNARAKSRNVLIFRCLGNLYTIQRRCTQASRSSQNVKHMAIMGALIANLMAGQITILAVGSVLEQFPGSAMAECAESGRKNAGFTEELTARETRFGELPDRFRRAHRIKGARHQLRRARAVDIVNRLGFQQLGVRQNDSELVV